MKTQGMIQVLANIAKDLGFVLLPIGCVRKHEVNHFMDASWLHRFPEGSEYVTREVEHHLLSMLADEVWKVALKETWPALPLPGTRTSARLVTVDMPAYLSWADSNGLKPFLTPHGFDFTPL